MNDQLPKPLEGEALEAIRAEKMRPDPSAAVRARVRTALQASLTGASGISPKMPADTATQATSALAGVTKTKLAAVLGLAFAAGGVAGATVHAQFARSESRASIVVAPPATSGSTLNDVTPESIAPTRAVETPPIDDSKYNAPSPPIASSLASPKTNTESALKAERALLDRARDALARGDYAEAMTAVDAHAQKYTAGRLTEEREALAIKSLVNLGHIEDARRRGERFRTRYPKSLLLPAIDNALGTNP